MISKRIYIGGPITGVDVATRKKNFLYAEDVLMQAGATSINPEEALRNVDLEHDEYLRINLAMIKLCDGILLLPGYERSRGTLMELGMAMALDKEIYELKDGEITKYKY